MTCWTTHRDARAHVPPGRGRAAVVGLTSECFVLLGGLAIVAVTRSGWRVTARAWLGRIACRGLTATAICNVKHRPQARRQWRPFRRPAERSRRQEHGGVDPGSITPRARAQLIPRTSCMGAGTQRIGQAAFAWCHHGGQTTTFTVVRSGFLTTILRIDLRRRMSADVRGLPPAALAVWGSGVRVPSAPPF
jgi:hypothetical protein